jgi:hypothetical protein
VGTGFLEDRGWIPLEIAKQSEGEPQNRLGVALAAGGRS